MTSTLLWTLIAIQIVMGAFDTFYHYEMTERLASKGCSVAAGIDVDGLAHDSGRDVRRGHFVPLERGRRE
jgi:hypothetical protein